MYDVECSLLMMGGVGYGGLAVQQCSWVNSGPIGPKKGNSEMAQ